MARNIHQIRIESILGGISPYDKFSTSDEFKSSLGINPDLPIASTIGTQTHRASGYLIPTVYGNVAATTSMPMWFIGTPKNNNLYVYGHAGTIASCNFDGSNYGEITSLTSSIGGGAEYYDNYVYFATNSTVARFGPLNQDSPTINSDFWGNSLGKTSLTNTVYPEWNCWPESMLYPNHVMHRHSNGKLYFADVVGNQGVLHCISTKKTTIEGDTDDGSTYNAIDFPQGMYPTAIESYGSDIAVALYESSNSDAGSHPNMKGVNNARLVFWDTTNPDNYYQITSVEFPDPFISALRNANGVLYTFSGYPYGDYTRICRFVGGYSFEQVAIVENSSIPIAGGVDSVLNKIIFTGKVDSPGSAYSSVFSIGSKISGISKVVNNMVSSGMNYPLGALKYASFTSETILTGGWNNDYNLIAGGLDGNSLNIDPFFCNSFWVSQVFRIGQPFKITKIKTNLATIPYNNYFNIVPRIYIDDTYSNFPSNYTLTGINMTTYTSRNYVHRPTNATGLYNFGIGYTWETESTGCPLAVDGGVFPIALPIIIEYELLDD